MVYQLPRNVYNLLEEVFRDRAKSEIFAKAIEESIQAIDDKVKEQINEKKLLIKTELKEELKKELVTNEFLINVKQELEHKIEELNFKIDNVKQELEFKIGLVEHKIDKQTLLIKVLIGLNIIALTFLNPTFVELIKSLIK